MDTQDTTELLAQLRDIHLPPTPPEPAIWPMIIAGIIIAVAAALLLRKNFSYKNTWAATATKELRQIEANADPAALLQTAELLKRIVITHDKNPHVRHLSGHAWLNYLNTFFNTPFFTTAAGLQFGNALYQSKHHSQPLTPKTYATLRKLIRRRSWQDD